MYIKETDIKDDSKTTYALVGCFLLLMYHICNNKLFICNVEKYCNNNNNNNKQHD